MKPFWTNRTTLFARMSLLFGLLVTVPLVISGIVLSIAGWNSVNESGDDVAKVGALVVDRSASGFQREAKLKMGEAGQAVAAIGKDRLQKSSEKAVQLGKDAVVQNSERVTLRGQKAVASATDAVVSEGKRRLESSLGDLSKANRESLGLVNQTFSAGMERELKDSDAAIRERLETPNRRSWEVSADRRITTVQDRLVLLQNILQNKLQYPLNTWGVIYHIPEEATQRLQFVSKNQPEVVRVVLVNSTGSETSRVPETDLAAGEEIDWAAKENARERKTFDAIQAATTVLIPEPITFDERSKLWVRRLVHKVPLPPEQKPEMVMPPPDADGMAVMVKPQPVPFVVVDLRVDKIVEDIGRDLPEGMTLHVIQAGTGKIIGSSDPKDTGANVKSILEKLPTGEPAKQFEAKARDFDFTLPDNSKVLGRAMYWDELDNCWTVVTQPESVVLKPLIALREGIQSAWQQSLNKVNGESGRLIQGRTDAARAIREQLLREAAEKLAAHKRAEQIKVQRDLADYRKQLVKDLDTQLELQIKELREKAGAGMDAEASKKAAEAFDKVKRASDVATTHSKTEIQDQSRIVANRAAGKMLSYSAWLIPLFLVLALFLATLTARSLVRPINQLVKGTQALAAGDYTRRIKIQGGDDELARLAVAFNDMAGAIESGQAQLLQSNEHLSAEKARIQGIVESSPDGLVMLEPGGQIAFINPAAAQLFDLDRSELPSDSFDVSQLPGAASSRLQSCLEHVQATNAVQEYEWQEPQRRVLQLREVNLRAENGRSYGRLLHVHDITRERVIDEMKSDFISLVSHELRTPLTSILGFSSYMLTGRLGPVADTQKTALESINRQAKRLSAIISDFLDVSRIESGKIEMKKEPVQVKSIASRVVEDLRPQAAEKQIIVNARVEEGSLPLVALGDEQRIAQVFTNLVGNALKFTEASGTIDVSLSRKNGEVECRVRDTGCGIPPDELDRVFDRFYQVEKVVTRKSGGTGLGLAIVKNIVEAHGGRIWIESRLGEGTQVSFTLPGSD
jgi:PAS domain S-box-containing protein